VTLPDLSSVQTAMCTARSAALPKNPSSRDEISAQAVLEKFVDTDGNSFLLDNTPDNRIMVFGDVEMLPRLASATTLHMDGTFWVVPFIFAQLLTIHSMIYGQMLPFFYVLLPGKSEAVYNEMFQMIFGILRRQNVVLQELRYVLSDFESGLISSVSSVFPDKIHLGCNFHFAQAVYRNMVSMGFQTLYGNNALFRSAIRHLLALGHVPTDWKLSYFDQFMVRFGHIPEVRKFVDDYFYPTWLNPESRRYDGSMWDWFGHSIRTNNHVEAWHAALKSFFKQPHLGFYKFLTFLLKAEKLAKRKLADRIAGKPLPKPNPQYRAINERITTLHSEIEDRTEIDYLNGIAYNVPNPMY
jgi:hypothetical protein